MSIRQFFNGLLASDRDIAAGLPPVFDLEAFRASWAEGTADVRATQDRIRSIADSIDTVVPFTSEIAA